ncbi:hypothetical protein ISCGN_016424 [Ixodes scapularis]
MFLPTYVRNDLLVQALSAHGKVLEITHATYRSTPTVKTGTRYVRIEMKESDSVPNFLRIGGHRATFDYPGIKRVCRRCRLEGHIRANCTTEPCDRCAVFGHATEGCTSDCRRCGGSHATVDCVARWSYSSMVAGTALSDFPPLSPAHEVSPPRPAAQTGAPTALTKPQANVDPKNSHSALSGGRPPPAPLTDAAGAMAPETQLVTPAPSLSAVDTHTPWSEVTEDPEVSSDDERLVIMEDESPVAEEPSLSSLGAPSTSVAPVTAGNKDWTNSSEPSDLAGNSDPTDARRGQAPDAKRAISSSGSRSPRGRDKAGRRPKKPRPSSRDTSFSSAEDVYLPRERGGWSFPCIKLTASTLALKTLLTILDDTDNPSRPLAVYLLGTLYSDLEPSQPPFIGARVETVPPFYRAAIETFRQLRAHVSKEDIVEAPASRLVEILYSSQFPAPVPGLPSYIGPPLPHGSLPGEVCDFQWKKGWGVLPTKDRLFRWGLVSDVKCPNCSAVETNVHVTAQCVVAQIFWRLVAHAFPDAGVRPYVNQGRRPRGNFAFLVIAQAEWVLWRNRCSSKVRQRCQRAMWPLLWRLRRELVTFLECELFLLGECEFLRRWSCRFLTVINGQVHLACLSLDML